MRINWGWKKGRYTYGLSLSDQEAKLVEIRPSDSRVAVTRRFSAPLPDGCVREGRIADAQAAAEALRTMVKDADLRGTGVNVAVPLSSVALRKAAFPSVKDRELRHLIDVDLHGGTPLPFQNPVFDFVRLGPAAEAGKDEVLIFATPRDVVEELIRTVRSAGLEPVAVDLVPLALLRLLAWHAVITGEEAPDRFMLLYVEAERVDVSIFADSVPVLFRSFRSSRNIWLEQGGDPLALFGRSLSIELSRLMNYYRYSMSSDHGEIRRIYMAFDNAEVKRLPEFLDESLRELIRPLPLERVLYVFFENTAEYDPYAVAIGLALKGA